MKRNLIGGKVKKAKVKLSSLSPSRLRWRKSLLLGRDKALLRRPAQGIVSSPRGDSLFTSARDEFIIKLLKHAEVAELVDA